jgi:hypothetical protein
VKALVQYWFNTGSIGSIDLDQYPWVNTPPYGGGILNQWGGLIQSLVQLIHLTCCTITCRYQYARGEHTPGKESFAYRV